MPQLPTLNGTDEQIAVLLQVFGNEEVFLQWLGQQIASYVEQKGRQFYAAQMEEKIGNLILLFAEFGVPAPEGVP